MPKKGMMVVVQKGKITMTITIGLVCFVLVYIMFIQFRVIEKTDIAEIEDLREAELTEKLADWKTKCEELEKQIKEKEEKIDEYKKSAETNEEASELLEKELKQSRMLLGVTKVTGDGIIITLEDNEEHEITATLLIELINELKLAGADAISINDERVVNITDIVEITSGDIIMNSGKNINSPFEIKVIGDQTYLDSALNVKNSGFADKYSKIGYKIKIEKVKDLEIPKYNGKMELKYIK